MSTGGASSGTAGILDLGVLGSPADNTFTRTDGIVGSIQPYWPAWWIYEPTSDGHLVLDTSDTEGSGFVDTMLNIRRDSAANAPFAGDDDSGEGPYGRASRLEVDVEAGVTYWVKVGSYDSDGSGITVYHLAATFVSIPTLPNPRTFTVPGGTLTAAGLVLSPAVVGAPSMPPLSVSTPTDGSLPDATFVFDATTYLAAAGVSSAYISFDATLSYLTDGTADSGDPEVGLNVFTVPHPMPFTWEEDWATLFIGDTSGVDDYGRTVPRGQSMVFVESGTTYIIQLTTPPGNDVRFILRVSDFGQHTADLLIPDQTWRVTNTPYASGLGDPEVYGPLTIPWARGNDHTFGAVSVDDVFPSWTLADAFNGQHTMTKGVAGPEPGGDGGAIACSWRHARRANAGGDYWTSDFTITGLGDPACRLLSDHESGAFIGDGRVGFVYQSSGSGSLSPGKADFDVYDSQFRLHATGILERFNAFAGTAPPTGLDAPPGYTNTGPIFSGPTSGTPELLAVHIAMDQLDSGTIGGSGTQMYIDAASYDNSDGSSDGWSPVEDAALGPEAWRGTTDGPEQYDGSHLVKFASADLTGVPLDVWSAALEDESTADTEGGPRYQGALRVVGLFGDQLVDLLPSPQPTGTIGESISSLSTYQFPVLFLELRPTVTYHFADYSTVPVAVLFGGVPPLRQYPRDDGLATSSTARLYPPPRSIQGSNRRGSAAYL